MEFDLDRWLMTIAKTDPTPAGGSLALVTLAGAAALASKCSRLSGMEYELFDKYAELMSEFSAEDARLYKNFTKGGKEEALAAVEAGLLHIHSAIGLCEELKKLEVKESLRLDSDAAFSLAFESALVLLKNFGNNFTDENIISLHARIQNLLNSPIAQAPIKTP